MKQKKLPMRTCVVTKEQALKKDLIRVVRTPEGTVIVDVTGKANGKGAYLKRDVEVVDKAIKNKALDRALGVVVPEGIYEELKSEIEK